MSKHHLLKIKKGDYIFARCRVTEDKEQDLLGRVTNVLESSFMVYAPKQAHIEKKTFEIQQGDVLFNLGPTPPKTLKIAGFDFNEVFEHVTQHKRFGALHWSFDPAAPEHKEAVDDLHKGFDANYAFLKAHGLEGITQLNIIYEMTHVKSKYIGRYQSSKDLEQYPGILRVSPLNISEASIQDKSYVIAHELGHVIDMQLLANRPKLKSRWLELYYETVEPVSIEKSTLAELLSQLKTAENMKQFRAGIAGEEELKTAARLVFKWVKMAHGLDATDLEHILLANTPDAIDKYWPKSSACFKINLKPQVSEYATKNPRELFAESFAFYVAERKLPKAIRELMEESLKAAAKTLPKVLSTK